MTPQFSRTATSYALLHLTDGLNFGTIWYYSRMLGSILLYTPVRMTGELVSVKVLKKQANTQKTAASWNVYSQWLTGVWTNNKRLDVLAQ